MRIKLLYTIAAVFGLTAAANAAMVTATFEEVSAGMFDVTVGITPEAGDTTGLAAVDFEIVNALASGVSFTANEGLTGVQSNFMPFGFVSSLQGPVPVGDPNAMRYAVGVAQNTGAPSTIVQNIGITDVNATRPGGFRAVQTGVPALIGTISAPTGMSADNFANIGIAILGPAGTSAFSVAPENLMVNVIPLTTQANPDLGLMASSGGTLSADLQAAFEAGDGSSILLTDGLMITNDDPNSDDLTELGNITDTTVEFTSYVGTPGLIGTVSAGSTAGKYNLLLQGPFQSFDPSVPLTGNVNFVSSLGGDASLSFSIAVPEPSTMALTGLAAVGLVGFIRRRK